MNRYRFSQLSADALLHALDEQAADERGSTAVLVALIAEVERRRLYARQDFSSMFDYCVRRLRLSEDSAYKRIQAARAARRFPGIFEAIADGRLSLTVLVKLRPHLTRENWRELLREAVHKTKTEVEHLLAARFPKPDMPTVIQPVAPAAVALPLTGGAPATTELVPEPVASIATAIDAAPVMGTNGMPAQPTVSTPPARVAPLSAQTYKVQFTMRRATHDKLRRLQELLGHRVPAGDLDAVLEHAFDAAISQIEKRKLGATDRPR
ncbi:MAG TPA: hypothetical protein VMJ70_09585, partial [Candidatus Sulfotelmatobacter sp.]|nr:hypothetical protein [Candidatus Sulfotelmatobacter sp.]